MKINWKVRFRNKTFWISFIPAVLLMIKSLLNLVGIEFDTEVISSKLLSIVEAVFVVFAVLGIITDPTTTGISDSLLAQEYQEPKKN